MRLIGRNDLFLLAGLSIALFAMISKPLGRILAYAHEVDETSGYQLLPGLVILAVVFMFHQMRKRHEVRSEALAAAAEVRQATTRAAETERLVGFGHALARSLDYASVRAVVMAYLGSLDNGRRGWVMVRTTGQWEPLTPVDDARMIEQVRVARRTLGEEVSSLEEPSREVCFPMVVAGTTLGVLCVDAEPALTEHKQTTLAAAAALLAVSLKNIELFRQIHDNSVRDSLTGCFNRRHALEVMDIEMRRSSRTHLPLSLVMFDLDHFKQINDRYGHLGGDAVLAEVAQRMSTVLRLSDLKCRFGGEEFLILLPETTLPGARRVAELLRRKLEERPVQWNTTTVPVTASFGLTAVKPGEVDALVIIGRADAALYRAKLAGRNCVCLADAQEVIS